MTKTRSAKSPPEIAVGPRRAGLGLSQAIQEGLADGDVQVTLSAHNEMEVATWTDVGDDDLGPLVVVRRGPLHDAYTGVRTRFYTVEVEVAPRRGTQYSRYSVGRASAADNEGISLRDVLEGPK